MQTMSFNHANIEGCDTHFIYVIETIIKLQKQKDLHF